MRRRSARCRRRHREAQRDLRALARRERAVTSPPCDSTTAATTASRSRHRRPREDGRGRRGRKRSQMRGSRPRGCLFTPGVADAHGRTLAAAPTTSTTMRPPRGVCSMALRSTLPSARSTRGRPAGSGAGEPCTWTEGRCRRGPPGPASHRRPRRRSPGEGIGRVEVHRARVEPREIERSPTIRSRWSTRGVRSPGSASHPPARRRAVVIASDHGADAAEGVRRSCEIAVVSSVRFAFDAGAFLARLAHPPFECFEREREVRYLVVPGRGRNRIQPVGCSARARSETPGQRAQTDVPCPAAPSGRCPALAIPLLTSARPAAAGLLHVHEHQPREDGERRRRHGEAGGARDEACARQSSGPSNRPVTATTGRRRPARPRRRAEVGDQ